MFHDSNGGGLLKEEDAPIAVRFAVDDNQTIKIVNVNHDGTFKVISEIKKHSFYGEAKEESEDSWQMESLNNEKLTAKSHKAITHLISVCVYDIGK